MDIESSFDRFCGQSPFAVMTQIVLRACIHNCFSHSFEQARGRQYEDVLTFMISNGFTADGLSSLRL